MTNENSASTPFLLRPEDLDGLVDVVRFGAKQRIESGHLTDFIQRLATQIIADVYPDLPTPVPADLENDSTGFFNVSRHAAITITPLETL